MVLREEIFHIPTPLPERERDFTAIKSRQSSPMNINIKMHWNENIYRCIRHVNIAEENTFHSTHSSIHHVHINS